MKRSEIFFGVLRIPVDFASAFAALLAAYQLRARSDVLPAFLKQPDLGTFPAYPQYFNIALAAAFAFVIIQSLFRLYSLRVTDSFASEIRKIAAASIIWLMAAITYYFAIREFPFSRLVLFFSAAFICVCAIAGRGIIRIVQRSLMRAGIGQRRVIFVGENAIGAALKTLLKKTGSVRPVATVKNFLELSALVGEKRGYIADEVIQTPNKTH